MKIITGDQLGKFPNGTVFTFLQDKIDFDMYFRISGNKATEITAQAYRTAVGDKIVKFYRMTNISTDDGMMKLLTRLRKLKVDDILEEMGAEDGDKVILDDFTFAI